MAHGPDPEEIKRLNEAVLKQEPNADAFASKIVMLGGVIIAGAFALSWLAAKSHTFEKLVHFLGGGH